MKPFNLKYQNGVALIMFVLVLMGVGGLLLVGYSQGILKQAEDNKFEHNKRVLKEAKQALLQFTYNYPEFNSEGPGRLPCPSPDTAGLPLLTAASCTSVRRFPWADTELNFYDARDADGEQLWYAVSSNFYNLGGGANIKSDQTGTITLVDQSQNIIYDGNGAGIAAVIIAPGPALAGQDRIANPDDPASYLDSINGFDNSIFTNGSSASNDDGFILGPVFDPAQDINVVNDQMIVITSDEVIEMAEKAVLQVYRTAINDYLTNTGGGYPWLYNYDNIGSLDDFPADLVFGTEFADNLTPGNFGRIPSMFGGDYFSIADSEPIQSPLSVTLPITFPPQPATVSSTASGNQQFNAPVTFTYNFLPTEILTDLRFDETGGNGRLTGTVTVPQNFTDTVFFWDEDNDPTAPTGLWTACLDDGDSIPEPSDCNRDNAGIPDPFLPSNETKSQLLRVVISVNFNGVVNFDYSSPPVINPPTPASNAAHAWVTASIPGADIVNLPAVVSYTIDRHYHSTFDIEESGTLGLGDLVPALTLGLRYYPVLPRWAFSNGWYDSVMMAYAPDYLPSSVSVPKNCITNPPCLQIDGLAGTNDDKISLLVLAGEHEWVDGDTAPAVAPGLFFTNDIGDVFNLENSNFDNLFDIRTIENTGAPGDTQLDKILVICELGAACP